MVTTKQTDLVAQLATLLHQAGPLAALVNSDEFFDEDRGRLRELVKAERLFDLSNHLNALCSRRAREVSIARGHVRPRGR